MNSLVNKAFLAAVCSMMVLVGCAQEVPDDVGLVGTDGDYLSSSEEEALNAPDEREVIDEASPPLYSILPGQCRIRASDGRYVLAAGKWKNPELRLAPNKKTCEMAPAKFMWVVETFGPFARIQSARFASYCIAFQATLNMPLDLKPCNLSEKQLLKLVPAPGGSDKVCSIENLCATFRGKKLFASTPLSAPGWYLECC